MTRIGFIESNTSGTGGLLLERALRRGYDVVFFTKSPDKYDFLSPLLVHPVVIDTSDADLLTRAIAQIGTFSAILSTSDSAALVASEISARLSLFGASPAGVKLCRRKDLIIPFLERKGVAQPRSVVISPPGLGDIDHKLAASGLEFPLVAKPCVGTGSSNVRLVRDTHELHAHLKSLFEIDDHALIQQYIDGTEYSVECLLRDDEISVMGCVRKHLSGPPWFVEIGHDFPAQLDDELQAKLIDSAKAVLHTCGLQCGAAHLEFRLSGRDPVLIEVNPRLAGGMIPVMLEVATGVDILGALLDLYLEVPILPLRPAIQRAAAIRFLPLKEPTIVGRIDGLDAAKTMPGVIDVRNLLAPGERVLEVGDFRARAACVIAAGVDYETAGRRADAAIEAMRIIGMAPDPGAGRLVGRLDPLAAEIIVRSELRAKPDILASLFAQRAVDEAHIIMLTQCRLIQLDLARKILRGLSDLTVSDMAASSWDRGFYIAYETALETKIGLFAGYLSMARSRNDLNATLFSRELLQLAGEIYTGIWELRSAIIARANLESRTPFPAYSQYRVAQPSTVGHVLLAIDSALERDLDSLLGERSALRRSPLGAGAGCGTTMAIDPQCCAALLGFEAPASNSLDAVAGYDTALRFVSDLASISTTLSRFSQSLQVWSTEEFDLVDFDDSVTGTSSMMPQKKNPYLLEYIKGETTRLVGRWVSMQAAAGKTPIGNSYEAGRVIRAEAIACAMIIKDQLAISTLLLRRFTVNAEAAERRLVNGLANATDVAEAIAFREGIPFRVAHRKVSHRIGDAIRRGESPVQALSDLSPEIGGEASYTWAAHREFGGGPGPQSLARALKQANERLCQQSKLIRSFCGAIETSDRLRATEVERLLGPVYN
ncbi:MULTISPECIES: lyase family protein [unclassified Bradyrhizobium]|uniref:lyase family protein n=1 Tax=unclassified Bradyrhizobium TaxID=2631580 RepID=UPI002916739A|nr:MULTISPECIES: lyase family protein [unclassified Bradyrhizobium]